MKLYLIHYDDGEDDFTEWHFASDDDIDLDDDEQAIEIALALGVIFESEREEKEFEWYDRIYIEQVDDVSIIKNGKHIKRKKKVVLK